MRELVIKFPDMRENLIGAIRYLANSETEITHKKVDGEGNLLEYFDFSLAVHIIYDDIPGMEDSHEGCIGDILKNEDEEKCMKELIKNLNYVLDVDEVGELDKNYILSKHWQLVIKSARKTLMTMSNS
jgi:hypothetical protein